ncbi:hypothetical protein SDC9_40329 [bioreactor metagenome]|uniref:HTH tetR-type domain-containing protein n=1 Tax=bioreactor metagenome TaxID=1076179 RepID=A0A644VS04_9ZZZZ
MIQGNKNTPLILTHFHIGELVTACHHVERDKLFHVISREPRIFTLSAKHAVHPAKTAVRRKSPFLSTRGGYFCPVVQCKMTESRNISYVKPAIWQNVVPGATLSGARLYISAKTMETKMSVKRFRCENIFYFCGMEEKLKHILEETTKLFLRYGIKSISMDDIARHLGISKKTLYQFFSDKKDLVLSVMNFHLEQTDSCFRQISEEDGNAIDILVQVSRLLIEKFGKLNPSVTFDLQKYYPEAFRIMMDHKHSHILENIERNLKRGIREGLYRKDINTRIIAYFYLVRMDHIFSIDPDNESMKDLSMEKVLTELFVYHIRGIANEKGIEYFETKLLKEIKPKK